nr:hypothetical protein Iba_chr04cCG0480 [Ipomoea batatas]GME03052.1 hypothetical protein Iba_scaffold445CG0030 [Ipomoea batatas]
MNLVWGSLEEMCTMERQLTPNCHFMFLEAHLVVQRLLLHPILLTLLLLLIPLGAFEFQHHFVVSLDLGHLMELCQLLVFCQFPKV